MSNADAHDGAMAPASGPAAAPWPQLRARRGADRETVRANQRERLHAAMIEAVAERGYTGLTTRRLRALAGVSEKTIYAHFPTKEDYFLSTYDRVVREAMGRIQTAYRAEGNGGQDWQGGLCRAFEAFASEIVERPRQSRLALLDALAAGPVAQARIESAEAVFAQMIAQSFAQAPDEVAMPHSLLRSLVGGIWFVTRSRLLRDRPSTIADSGRELLDWMLTYRDPAVETLPRQGPVPRPYHRDRYRRSERDERTGLLRAVAELAAQGELPSLTSLKITRQAGLESAAFSRHFESVADCFLASLELMSIEAVARARQESKDAGDWASALCRSVRAVLCQIGEDPVLARAAFIAVYSAEPSRDRRRANLMRSFAALLGQRAPDGSRPSALVSEAIVGSVWSIAYRYVVHDRAFVLPSLWPKMSYLTLAPIVGAEAALETITSELALSARTR